MTEKVGSPKDNLLYHITFKSRLDSILKLGLLPARDLKKMGFEQPYPSDDRFVHLFNPIRMKKNLGRASAAWLLDKEIIEVKLPASFSIEHEYDQAVISLRLAGAELEWFMRDRTGSRKDYVCEYFRKTHGIDYSGRFTIKEVCDFIDDRISDDEWAQNDGSYRTKVPISPECLRVVLIDRLAS